MRAYKKIAFTKQQRQLSIWKGCLAGSSCLHLNKEQVMLRTMLAIIAALAAASSSAQETDRHLHWCDGCSAEQEKTFVRNLNPANNISIYYYVGNISARTLHKYLLFRDSSQPSCSPSPGDSHCNPSLPIHDASKHGTAPASPADTVGPCEVYEMDVEPEIAEGFDNAMNYYYLDPVGWRKKYEIQIVK